MNDDSITRIFCDVDDFCARLERYCTIHLLPIDTGSAWFPRNRLTLSEVMTIAILFHLSGYQCFKWYYQEHGSKQLARYFPHLVSYNRFVELMSCSVLPLTLYPALSTGKANGHRLYRLNAAESMPQPAYLPA